MTAVLEHCELDACKVCSACVYSQHPDCAKTVTCPNTGEENICRCCGDAR